MNKFRPQEISKSYIMKQRLKYGRVDNHNWQIRGNWVPAGLKKNQISILRRWRQIHHYACHAPKPAQHWIIANRMFNKTALGDAGRASLRYLNTWSSHSWL